MARKIFKERWRGGGGGSKADMTDIGAEEPFDAVVASANEAMVVVTVAAGEQRAGCLVGFHSQTSIEPRRYTVWLSKANHTYRVALLATHLAIHFLTDADRDLAEVFGAVSGDDIDKFARSDWEPGPHGVPLLHRCPNRLVMARTTLLDDGGDHVAVSARPIAAHSAGGFTPLRFADVRDLDPGHEADERPGSVPDHGHRGS
jgi:flavin reductase (DIM6/NTAB) family NADH-FMN oxidoreductase RutF